MKLDIATIRALHEGGVTLLVNLREPWGGCTITLKPEQVSTFLEDADQFAADLRGVLKHQYLDWIETDGTPRCGVTTQSGARCKNFVSGGIQHDLEDWLQLDGGFCAVHGGESSSEAREKRWQKE